MEGQILHSGMGGKDIAWRLAALGLAWPAGAFMQMHERALQAGAVYLALCALGVLLCAAGWRWRQAFGLAVVGVALLAAGSTGWRAGERLADALPASLEGQDIEVSGVVASLPQVGSNGVAFSFEVDAAHWRGEPVRLPSLLALAWYSGFRDDTPMSGPQTELRAGQAWRFTVRLRKPHGNLNPHGFDRELYLFERGIRATGYVRGTAEAPPQLLRQHAGHPVERWRQRVRDAIEAQVSDPRAAGVLAALAVGDQGAIEREDWQLFRTTGVAHLMSISGLHVTMFAWLAGLGVAALWRRSPRAMLWLPAPLAGRAGGLMLAVAYAVFSGWGVPAQRTVWMLATAAALQGLGRHWPWPLVLLAAGAVVSAIDPWALLQPGFWLSFAAVGLLMASAPAQLTPPPQVPPGWRGWAGRLQSVTASGLRTQVVATLGLAPLTLVFFQQISVVGFAANLVAIPLVTLVITPLALLGVAAPPLWSVAAWIEQQLAAGLAWAAQMPSAVWMVPVAPTWAQWAGLFGAVLLVMPLPWRLRWLAVPLVLPLLMPMPERPAPGGFELLAVDVGQGSAVLVRTHGHLLVYDTGPQYSRDSDAGQRVLLPLLRARGEAVIDRLVLSHRDSDHVGGAATLLAELPVRSLHGSLEDGHPLRTAGVPFQRCEAGQSWVWDGVRFEVLHPQAADHARALKPNALSCVLRVSGPQGSALLAGDIERDQEAALVAALGPALKADMLLVPHHGSRTSSTPDFLRAVQPVVAVVQSGYRNRFNHPAPEVLWRLRSHVAQVRTIPACGAWRWAAGETAASGTCQRQTAPRYWHHEGVLELQTPDPAHRSGLDIAN